MKIAITGTHSSGKTTLARSASELLGLQFMRGDTIKQIMEATFPNKSLDDLTKEENWKLESLGLDSRIDAEKEHESFISDGCTLNSIAYLTVKLGVDIKKIKDFNIFCDKAKKNAEKYDYIIYLPPEIPLENDGFRPMSEKFRIEIDKMLCEILKDYKFYVVKGSLEERLEQIKLITKL